MDSMFLPIVAASAVMLLVFTGWKVIAVLTDAERRKLKQRLSTEGRADIASTVQRNIVVQQRDASGVSGVLAQVKFFENLQKGLIHAYPEMSLGKFVAIMSGAGFFLFLITIAVANSLLVALVAGVIGAWIPCMVVGQKRNKRQRLLADQLPEALDFLSRILKAGHSLSTGLQMMSEELPKPLAQEFRVAYDQHSLGQSMEDCLKAMAVRIESTDFAFFVTATLIQRQTGGDLSEVLGNISGMIRQRIRLQQHVKAKTAEGRFTGYILTAFPAVMFVIAYVLNPEYAGVLVHTTTGLILLGVAFGLQLMGLFFIKKITTVVV